MSANTAHGNLGYGQLEKLGGSGAIVTGTEIFIPATVWMPRSPKNNAFPPMVNKSAFPANVVKGKRTPSCGFQSMWKTSWGTVNLFNSLMFSVDANGDNDRWSWRGFNGKTSRIYDGARCAALSLASNAAGGPVLVECGFLAETDQGITSFIAPAGPDAGYLVNAAQIDFGAAATADLVSAWRINWIRGVGYDWYFNQTYYPAGTSTGLFSGTLQLIQSPEALVVPSTAITIRFHTGEPGALVLFASFSCLIFHDEDVEDINVGFGEVIRSYTFIDIAAGGNPAIIT